MEMPLMLNKIILELGMNLSILSASMRREKSPYPICVMLLLNRILIGDVPKVLRHATLIFNDHVMQDDATCHDFS